MLGYAKLLKLKRIREDCVVKKTASKSKKLFVLDTNVLIHDPHALFAFEKSIVGIPSIAIEELDSFKREATDRGRNARESVRMLDELREKGSLRDGVQIDNGAIVQVLFLPYEKLPQTPFQPDTADNKILLITLIYKEKGYDVRFISKDLNARVKADILGIESEDYKKESISIDNFYRGWTHLTVPAVELKRGVPTALKDIEDEIATNEYVLLENQHNPHIYRIFRYQDGNHKEKFTEVFQPKFPWPLEARNPQQIMALDLLMNDSIPFISLFGPAGTGKTFLALLVALYKTLMTDTYEKILISRPVIPLGRDIGFLPGTMEEKLHNWMMPIYDNLQFIMHSIQTNGHIKEIRASQDLEPDYHDKYPQKQHHDQHHKKHHKKDKHHRHRGKSHPNPQQQLQSHLSLDKLLHSGKMQLEAITYMRGRSIPYQFILIDEAQNLTPHEIKTLVTRVGAGSKIVLAGDPYQIDSPYLDFSSNGLVVASERFKGEPLFGTIYLETSERSTLSKLASEIL